MKKENVMKMSCALGLTRKIVGVRFLYSWAEYQDTHCDCYNKRTRFCVMIKHAGDGFHFKCEPENFGCGRSRKALGIEPNDSLTASGQIFYSCGLYSSRAVAKQAQDATLFIDQELYGIEVAPLDELNAADVVILFGDSYQMMRIVQGYTYQYGLFHSMSSVGNQGVCSDLCARPFMTNDMNISSLCEGTRRACKWSHNDIGAGLPVNLFDGLVDGVLQTLDLIDSAQEKERIRARLDSENDLGVPIDPNNYYGVSCGTWWKKQKNNEERYEEYLLQKGAEEKQG